MSALTNMPIVIVSHEGGTVTMLRRGKIVREFSSKERNEAASFMTEYLRRLLIRQAVGEVRLGIVGRASGQKLD